LTPPIQTWCGIARTITRLPVRRSMRRVVLLRSMACRFA